MYNDAPCEDGMHVCLGGRYCQCPERQFPVVLEAQEADHTATFAGETGP